ncbi:hypothetical protein B0O99DRAFT_721386 [Bisporella sp. PMI_857]|nr:hypothetical protein B0O99DRAFT_721386 [Bisporella sp. PMI_857]
MASAPPPPPPGGDNSNQPMSRAPAIRILRYGPNGRSRVVEWSKATPEEIATYINEQRQRYHRNPSTKQRGDYNVFGTDWDDPVSLEDVRNNIMNDPQRPGYDRLRGRNRAKIDTPRGRPLSTDAPQALSYGDYGGDTPEISSNDSQQPSQDQQGSNLQIPPQSRQTSLQRSTTTQSIEESYNDISQIPLDRDDYNQSYLHILVRDNALNEWNRHAGNTIPYVASGGYPPEVSQFLLSIDRRIRPHVSDVINGQRDLLTVQDFVNASIDSIHTWTDEDIKKSPLLRNFTPAWIAYLRRVLPRQDRENEPPLHSCFFVDLLNATQYLKSDRAPQVWENRLRDGGYEFGPGRAVQKRAIASRNIDYAQLYDTNDVDDYGQPYLHYLARASPQAEWDRHADQPLLPEVSDIDLSHFLRAIDRPIRNEVVVSMAATARSEKVSTVQQYIQQFVDSIVGTIHSWRSSRGLGPGLLQLIDPKWQSALQKFLPRQGIYPPEPPFYPLYFVDMLNAIRYGAELDEWIWRLNLHGLEFSLSTREIQPQIGGPIPITGQQKPLVTSVGRKPRITLVQYLQNLLEVIKNQDRANYSPDVHGSEAFYAYLITTDSKLETRRGATEAFQDRGYDPQISGTLHEFFNPHTRVTTGDAEEDMNQGYDPTVHGPLHYWRRYGRPTTESLLQEYGELGWDPQIHGTIQQWSFMGRPTREEAMAAIQQVRGIRGVYYPPEHGSIHQWFAQHLKLGVERPPQAQAPAQAQRNSRQPAPTPCSECEKDSFGPMCDRKRPCIMSRNPPHSRLVSLPAHSNKMSSPYQSRESAEMFGSTLISLAPMSEMIFFKLLVCQEQRRFAPQFNNGLPGQMLCGVLALEHAINATRRLRGDQRQITHQELFNLIFNPTSRQPTPAYRRWMDRRTNATLNRRVLLEISTLSESHMLAILQILAEDHGELYRLGVITEVGDNVEARFGNEDVSLRAEMLSTWDGGDILWVHNQNAQTQIAHWQGLSDTNDPVGIRTVQSWGFQRPDLLTAAERRNRRNRIAQEISGSAPSQSGEAANRLPLIDATEMMVQLLAQHNRQAEMVGRPPATFPTAQAVLSQSSTPQRQTPQSTRDSGRISAPPSDPRQNTRKRGADDSREDCTPKRRRQGPSPRVDQAPDKPFDIQAYFRSPNARELTNHAATAIAASPVHHFNPLAFDPLSNTGSKEPFSTVSREDNVNERPEADILAEQQVKEPVPTGSGSHLYGRQENNTPIWVLEGYPRGIDTANWGTSTTAFVREAGRCKEFNPFKPTEHTLVNMGQAQGGQRCTKSKPGLPCQHLWHDDNTKMITCRDCRDDAIWNHWPARANGGLVDSSSCADSVVRKHLSPRKYEMAKGMCICVDQLMENWICRVHRYQAKVAWLKRDDAMISEEAKDPNSSIQCPACRERTQDPSSGVWICRCCGQEVALMARLRKL